MRKSLEFGVELNRGMTIAVALETLRTASVSAREWTGMYQDTLRAFPDKEKELARATEKILVERLKEKNTWGAFVTIIPSVRILRELGAELNYELIMTAALEGLRKAREKAGIWVGMYRGTLEAFPDKKAELALAIGKILAERLKGGDSAVKEIARILKAGD